MKKSILLLSKRLYLLIVLLGSALCSAYADTESLETEVDGFQWIHWSDNFSFVNPTHQGAKNTSGQVIVPKKFYMVFYHDGELHAQLSDGRAAIYSTDGRCIIPAERGYYSITKQTTDDGTVFYSVDKDRTSTSYSYSHGICDANGREIIAPQYPDIIYSDDEGFMYEIERDTSNDPIGIGSEGAGKYEWVKTGIGIDGKPFVKRQPQVAANSAESSDIVPAGTAELLIKAQQMFDEGKYKEVAMLAQKLNETFPRPELQCIIGRCYTKMEQPEEAFKWYKQSADGGYAEGQYRTGYCYYYGEGVKQNKEKAISYLIDAVAQNHPEALLMMGMIMNME